MKRIYYRIKLFGFQYITYRIRKTGPYQRDATIVVNCKLFIT